jgi:hypothetical protein
MTQEQITHIINMYYSDKIQMGTLTVTEINLLLFKLKDNGLKEFKGYPASIVGFPFETEQDVRNVIDQAILVNQDWYNG